MHERVRYVEIHARNLLNRVDSPNVGFHWSINPYQGCAHDCVYCYARSTHAYRELDPVREFAAVIYVKVNAVEALRADLRRPSWKREQVAIGTATDPYQPAEGRYRLTRGILQVLAEQCNPAGLVTKNSMILRDVDVLQELSRRTRFSICFSLTSVDPELGRRLEPDVPPPQKRLRVMEQLVQAGVHAGVLMAPIVPGITDKPELIDATVRAAAEHGARFLAAGTLHLRGNNFSYLRSFLGAYYPKLLSAYERGYQVSPRNGRSRTGAPPDWYRDRVHALVDEAKARHNLVDHDAPEPEVQLSLPLA